MSTSLPILSNARIAAPCNMSWNAMRGDDRARFCGACEKNVFNLVGMSDEDVTALILEKEGKLCVRLYQRHDGTLLAGDCPVGLRAARRKLSRAIAAIAACVGLLVTATTFGFVGAGNRIRLVRVNPFSRIANWLVPPPPQVTMGGMVIRASPNTTPKKFVCPSTDDADPGTHGTDVPARAE